MEEPGCLVCWRAVEKKMLRILMFGFVLLVWVASRQQEKTPS
jgi:hypothetical protein